MRVIWRGPVHKCLFENHYDPLKKMEANDGENEEDSWSLRQWIIFHLLPSPSPYPRSILLKETINIRDSLETLTKIPDDA